MALVTASCATRIRLVSTSTGRRRVWPVVENSTLRWVASSAAASCRNATPKPPLLQRHRAQIPDRSSRLLMRVTHDGQRQFERLAHQLWRFGEPRQRRVDLYADQRQLLFQGVVQFARNARALFHQHLALDLVLDDACLSCHLPPQRHAPHQHHENRRRQKAHAPEDSLRCPPRRFAQQHNVARVCAGPGETIPAAIGERLGARLG